MKHYLVSDSTNLTNTVLNRADIQNRLISFVNMKNTNIKEYEHYSRTGLFKPKKDKVERKRIIRKGECDE